MPRKPGFQTETEVERDFLSALERLAARKPRHPELRERAARGALRVTVAAVALEAGRSRRLIAQARGCPYPEIRRRVLELAHNAAAAGGGRRTDIEALRAEVQALRSELENASSEILAHLAARREAEEECDAWRRRFERLRSSTSSQ